MTAQAFEAIKNKYQDKINAIYLDNGTIIRVGYNQYDNTGKPIPDTASRGVTITDISIDTSFAGAEFLKVNRKVRAVDGTVLDTFTLISLEHVISITVCDSDTHLIDPFMLN